MFILFYFSIHFFLLSWSHLSSAPLSSIPVLKLISIFFYHLSPFVFVGYTVTSVVSARSGQLYVAGAPRFNHTGKVIIFTMRNTGELTILHSLKGQQVKHLKHAYLQHTVFVYNAHVFSCIPLLWLILHTVFVCSQLCFLTVPKYSKAAFPLLSRTVLRTPRNGSRLTVLIVTSPLRIGHFSVAWLPVSL